MQIYAEYNEFRQRGTVDFPIELHRLDRSHPRYQMPYHWHHEQELLRVVSGSFVLSLDDEKVTVPAGGAVLIGSGVLHGGMPEDCRYECLVFEPEVLLKNRAAADVLQKLFDGEWAIRPVLPAGDPYLRRAVAELFAVADDRSEAGRLTLLGAMYRFYGYMLQRGCYDEHPEKSGTARRKMMQLKKALTFIQEHYSEPVTLGQIAAQAELSPRYFCRFFQQMTRRSPIEYLNYYRVEQAGDRLLRSSLTVTEVAYSCGFNDLSYFIRVFKRQKGVTPKQYGGKRPA